MTNATFDAECIVIGSGPAGVSVTFPLVEAGVRILMIDGSCDKDSTVNDFTDRWKKMLGPRLEALLPEDGLSPKLRTPAARQIANDFNQSTNICGEQFVTIGAKTRGGLSRLWGGLVCEFDAEDIKEWPFSIADLRPSYQAVTNRIGVSGSSSDDMASFFGRSGEVQPPLPVGLSAARLLNNYHSGSYEPNFALGFARNAILTLDRAERYSCDLRKDCLWGCVRGAVYDARFDLLDLRRYPTFRLVDNAFAVSLARSKTGWTVFTKDGRSFSAPYIVLAAGTLGTAELVIPLLPNAPSELRLLNNPVLAMPLLVPTRLGRSPHKKGYSLAQLGYRLRYDIAATEYVTGAIYEVDGLPSASFTARLPFGRRAGTQIFSAISSALLVATCYFPGTYSNNRLQWQRKDDVASIVVRGGADAHLPLKLQTVIRHLRKIWWQLGALMLPGASLATAGTDVHYAGVFAMGSKTMYGSTSWGELNSAAGLYIADGAALPTLPSKFPTLTIMANADRIGQHLASIATRH